MRFTLYVQRSKGRQIEKPRGVPIASVTCDGIGSKAYAWDAEGRLAVNELLVHAISIAAHGLLISGVEGAERLYYQTWWLVPEEKPERGTE